MRLRFFLVDRDDQLQSVPQSLVEEFWRGDISAARLPCTLGQRARILTVLVDEDIHPHISFFLRVDLKNGVITDAARDEVREAVTRGSDYELEHPLVARQFRGWPDNWQTQLAVALDVPVAELRNVGIGGPLPLADIMGLSMNQVLHELTEALQRDE